MRVDAVIARAQSAVGQGIRYGLGKGGMNPGAASPASSQRCDCSGFVAWCLFMSRKTNERFYVDFNSGWLETTAMWTDIGTTTGIFDPVAAKRGAIIVVPDKNGRQGHVGILSSAKTVIHCSVGNERKHGDAIRETDLAVFGASKRYGWLVGLQ